MLFGLMVVSAAFVVSGFYGWAAARVGALDVAPPVLLAILIGVAGGLSALLTNDVVVVAMTPLLVSITLSRGLNPVPFLLAFCFAANTGSAGTIIGSPQNMIAAQGLGISFNGFLRVAGAAGAAVAADRLGRRSRCSTAAAGGSRGARRRRRRRPRRPSPVNRLETAKAALVTLGVVAAFVLTDWPRELIALGGASLLLVNRTHRLERHAAACRRRPAADADGPVHRQRRARRHRPAAARCSPTCAPPASTCSDPLWLLGVVSVLSNVVGNNPAVMLLVALPRTRRRRRRARRGARARHRLFLEPDRVRQPRRHHRRRAGGARRACRISFGEFARAGVPVALACLALAAAWIALLAP